jgi:ABC-type branched-subunit amino acid transport system ATPase component
LNAWNITKVWGRKPGNRVIDDLDLTLQPGTLRWIGGSNGVGKTTLLHVLAGLIGPTEGHVHMFGLHPEHDRRAYQQRLSFLPATSTGLHARLTVRRQLDYTARINFVPREHRAAAVEESIKRFPLLAASCVVSQVHPKRQGVVVFPEGNGISRWVNQRRSSPPTAGPPTTASTDTSSTMVGSTTPTVGTYVQGDTHTNTVEGFFGHLKPSIRGT